MKSRTVRKFSFFITLIIAYHGNTYGQIACSNPLEYIALANGNILINKEIKGQISDQEKTTALQNTIAAEYTQMKSWQNKYNAYLKDVSGYASTLKASTTLYNEGARMLVNLWNLKRAISNNPQGIVASMSMNNLYLETATELISVFNTLNDAIAKGGSENMLTGAERSKTIWAINDKMTSLNKKLNALHLSIRYYTMNDVWNNATAGMIDRTPSECANIAYERWRRSAKLAYQYR